MKSFLLLLHKFEAFFLFYVSFIFNIIMIYEISENSNHLKKHHFFLLHMISSSLFYINCVAKELFLFINYSKRFDNYRWCEKWSFKCLIIWIILKFARTIHIYHFFFPINKITLFHLFELLTWINKLWV